jgi:hypothetical protein
MLKSSQIFPSKQFFSRWLQGEGAKALSPQSNFMTEVESR